MLINNINKGFAPYFLMLPYKLTLSLWLVLGFFLPYAVDAQIKVPVGFEELIQGQTLFVDVVLYGQSLGLYEAHIDLQSVTFNKPQALKQVIADKFNDSPELAALLSDVLIHPLARNGQLACSSNGNAPGCNYIDTDSVALIYDENDGNINLFLNKNFLPKEIKENLYHQQSTDIGNALVHQQSINFVAGQNYQSMSIQGNGALGITDTGYLGLDWNYQNQQYGSHFNQSSDITNAFLRHDALKKYYIQAGRMDTRDIFSNAGGNISLNQLPIGVIEGVRIGSTLSWLNTKQISRGTPVTLFLTRDARVDAYRGEQLLGSFYFNAGAQTLNTENFPYGSYNVTLRIYENNQLTRTEAVAYTNTGSNIAHSTQWFLQGGNIADRSNSNAPSGGNQVIQAGIKIPLIQRLQLTSGTALTRHTRFWENAIDWSHGFDNPILEGVLSMRGSYLTGSDGTQGNIQQVSYSDGFSLSFYRSMLNSPKCDSQQSRQYNFSGCAESSSFNVSLPLSGWYFNAGYNLSTSQGRYGYQLPTSSTDLSPFDQIYETRSRSETWQAGVNRSFSLKNMHINPSVSLFTRKDSYYNNQSDNGILLSVNLSLANFAGYDQRSSYTNVGMTYQKQQQSDQQLGYNASYNTYSGHRQQYQLGAAVNGINTDSLNGSLSGRMDSKYGNAGLTVSDAWQATSSKHVFSSSGNYSSALAVARSGLYWGRWGNGQPNAAIGVNSNGLDQNEEGHIEVDISGAGKIEIATNAKALFAVQSHQPLTLHISESIRSKAGASSEITHGSGMQTVFMSPGKMFIKNLSVSSSYTYLGRLLAGETHPIVKATLLNVKSYTPLGNGGFTLETELPIEQLYLVSARQIYQCAMKVKTIRDVVRYVGSVHCQSIALAMLPEAIQPEAKLLLARMQ